MILHLKISD